MHRLWLKQHLVDHGVLYLPHHLVTMDQIERYIQNHSYEIHQQITYVHSSVQLIFIVICRV